MAEPRGIRNNNPGNIEDGPFAQSIPGYAGSDGRFAKFETPDAGMTAIDRLLSTYNTKHGIDTVQGAINRWAPPSDNNPTSAYAQYVASKAGVMPTQKLDFQDPSVRQKIAAGIFEFENGKQAPAGSAGSSPPAERKAAISYDDMFVPQLTPTISQAQAETKRAEAREVSSTLLQGAKDAVNTSWIVNNLLGDTPAGKAATADPNFRWDPEQFKEATKTLPQEYWPALANAHSQDHALWLKDRIDEQLAARKRLESLGWAGTALEVGATLLDPAALGIALATEGSAAAFLIPAKASRLATVLGRATSGALAGAAVVAAQDYADLQTHSTSDYLLGAGLGLGLGGVLGFMHRGLPPDVAGKITAAGQRLTAEGEAIPGSLSAAKAHGSDFFTLPDEELASIINGDTPKQRFRYFRFDESAKIDRSNIGLARAMGDKLLENPVGNVGGVASSNATAELEMRKFYQADAIKIVRLAMPLYEEFAAKQGFNLIQKEARVGEWLDSVGQYMRSQGKLEVDDTVKKMHKQIASFFADRLDHQQNPYKIEGQQGRAVAGSENVLKDEWYLPRIADLQKFNYHVDRFGTDQLKKLVAGSIKDAQPYIDDAMAEKMAKGWVKRRHAQGAGIHDDPRMAFMSSDEDALRKVLSDEYGLSKADIDNVIKSLPVRDKEGGGAESFFKRRIDLNEGFEMKLQPKFGGEAEVVRFSDFLVNDALKLADMYNRRTAGRIALARVKLLDHEGNTVLNGITKDSEWQHFLKVTSQQAADQGVDAKTIESTIKSLNWAHEMILGRPQDFQTGKFAEFSRWVRKYNFARLMNLMGFNQFQELSNIAGQTSMKAMMQQMPTLRRIREVILEEAKGPHLPEGLTVKVGVKSDIGSQEVHLVDGSGKTHYRAILAIPSEGDGMHGFMGVSWIENVSREHKGVAPAFYKELARIAESENSKLIVGASASAKAKKVHAELEKLGIAKKVDPDTIKPGLAAEASTAGETLYHVKSSSTIEGKGGWVRAHALDRDLEAFGLATEELRNNKFIRWDEGNLASRNGQSSLASKAENALDLAGRATSHISLFKYINEVSQLWASKAAAQTFADLASAPTSANLKRMASLGLDEKQLSAVLKEIKAHSSIEEGPLFGGKLTALNLDNWSNTEARVAFENALFRWSRRIIQENDFGSMAKWMSHPAAQMVLQFRVFQTNAWAKQFLHNVHIADPRAFATFAYSMGLGAAVYMVSEQLKSIGRKDRQQHLEKRLDPAQIGKAAFARSAWSSWLPTIADTGRVAVGLKPWFDTRTSGQPSDFIFGNPGSGLIDDILKATKGTVSPTLQGRARTREDTVNMIRPLIWQNALPVTILMNYLTSGMPDRSPRQ